MPAKIKTDNSQMAISAEIARVTEGKLQKQQVVALGHIMAHAREGKAAGLRGFAFYWDTSLDDSSTEITVYGCDDRFNEHPEKSDCNPLEGRSVG